MSKDTATPNEILENLPDDLAATAQRFVKDTFRVLSEQGQQLGKDIAEFTRNRSETKERIRRGTRRTSGRVV